MSFVYVRDNRYNAHSMVLAGTCGDKTRFVHFPECPNFEEIQIDDDFVVQQRTPTAEMKNVENLALKGEHLDLCCPKNANISKNKYSQT